ncbi:MAG: ABC transporter substrate-binding protein, partial [Bacilli bacterium]|nr:ABC transporter substrate-binding protein [Bacilli bacterium]
FTVAMGIGLALGSCGGNGTDTPVTAKFDFKISFASGATNKLYLNKVDSVIIREINPNSINREYVAEIANKDGDEYVTISQSEGEKLSFTVKPKKVTFDPVKGVENTLVLRVTEKASNIKKSLQFTIGEEIINQNAGQNFASDPEARTEILGKLEKYAMENYLTGISLFENGGFVRYSKRVKLPTEKYIPGYGFGVLSEGELDPNYPLAGKDIVRPTYLQSASTSDPMTINAWDATGSQVGDLNSYISTAYWGTKMKGDTYEWYPVLAKDTVNGQPNNAPIAVPTQAEIESGLNMYKTWKVYVKTGEEEGVAYRTAATSPYAATYNKRGISLYDYESVYQMLLSQESGVTRGAELANDTTYGIKGGSSYFLKTKGVREEMIKLTPEEVAKYGDRYPTGYRSNLDKTWDDMKESGELGVQIGKDAIGSYIQLELVNPIDQFTAMYTLSSNLYSPMPKEFIRSIGGGDYTKGMKDYGTFKISNPVNSTLSCGPFFLDEWNTSETNYTVFTRNDDWFEVGPRYKIPGVVVRVFPGASEQPDAIYNQFQIGMLDSTGIPSNKMDEKNPITDKETEGDSTFKLNVNSCTQERWNELFGKGGSIDPSGTDNAYICKPWMSNKNFLKGLYWSINRKAFALARGVKPSINYFSDSYLSKPNPLDREEGESGVYNDTDAHKEAVANFHGVSGGEENYGYNISIARSAFKLAVLELHEAGKLEYGTAGSPTVIKIHIRWMYQSDTREYGDEIAKYMTDAFNNPEVCGGKVKLEIEQEAVAVWDQVYNDYLMKGKYDLGFGAISGNSYNPLNFMEVLKSDNSSGFTLNWGADTGKVDKNSPIMFDAKDGKGAKAYSYDALWAAGDHGAVISNGENVDPVKTCYIAKFSSNYFEETGAELEIPFQFVDITPEQGVALQFISIKLYLATVGTIDLTPKSIKYDETTGAIISITLSFTAAECQDYNKQLIDANNLTKKADETTDKDLKDKYTHPFQARTYGLYWLLEVHYTLSIAGGVPSENVTYVNYTKKDEESKSMSLASLSLR